MSKLIAIFVALGLAFTPAMAKEVTVKTGDVIHVKAQHSVVYKTVPVPVYHTVYKTVPFPSIIPSTRRIPSVGSPLPRSISYVQRGGILTETARGVVTGGEAIGSGVYHGAVGVATGVGDVLVACLVACSLPRLLERLYPVLLLRLEKGGQRPSSRRLALGCHPSLLFREK